MKIRTIGHLVTMLPPLLLGLAGSSLAVDGIALITQTSTTVFPIKISTSGSDRLASDLKVTSTTADAIEITANNVTLDLNGFSIIGPGSGSGIGINSPAAHLNVSVSNGTVTGMGLGGIFLGDNAHVAGVTAVSNFGTGIQVGNRSEVTDSAGNANSSEGIHCGADCVIYDNTANGNTIRGICTSTGGSIIRNSAAGNGVGLDLDTNSGYGKNVMENNGSGCVVNGTSMGDNVCNGVRS